MSALKKPIVALFGVLAVLVTGLLFASSAQADPYVKGVPPTTSVSSNTCGSPVTISGTGYKPGETVVVTENGTNLGSFTADGTGSFSGSITAVCNGTEPVTIVSRGTQSGAVDSLTFGPASNGAGGNSTGGSGSGGLSNTGVAVIGIGALGVVLLFGGGLLLLAGRRRTGSAV